MKKSIVLAACLSGALFLTQSVAAHEQPAAAGESGAPASEAPAPPPGLKLETLMREVLEGVEGVEVIVSKVTVPPNTSLPKHWHPGEEFAYILDGTVTLWQDGKDDTVLHAGETAMVPLKQVHTAITGDVGATLIVFRVHEEGQPERVLVE